MKGQLYNYFTHTFHQIFKSYHFIVLVIFKDTYILIDALFYIKN